MQDASLGGRALKKKVHAILAQDDAGEALSQLQGFPPRQVVNPLIGLLCSHDEALKWRAVTALGGIVSRLARTEMESAREVMRRFLWHMNEESGGIGWGVPEAMGEVMARHEGLAREFGAILISYICEDQNYLEHDALRRGALWGVGRAAMAHPRLMAGAAPALEALLQSPDPFNRGLAAWSLGWLQDPAAMGSLERLADDHAGLALFSDGRLTQQTVGALAAQALERIREGRP